MRMRPGKESSRPGARFIRAARDFLRACAENLRGEKTMASAASGEACSGGKPARSGAAVRGSCTFTGNGIRSFPPPLSATKTAAFWESASETDLSLPTLREMLTAKTNISQLCHGPLNLWHAKASRKRLAFVVDAPLPIDGVRKRVGFESAWQRCTVLPSHGRYGGMRGFLSREWINRDNP